MLLNQCHVSYVLTDSERLLQNVHAIEDKQAVRKIFNFLSVYLVI